MEFYKGEIKKRLPLSYFGPPTPFYDENGEEAQVFTGPVTIQELKMRVEMDKKMELRRQMKKKSGKDKENIPATNTNKLIQISEPNKADTSNSSNKTYDLEMSPKQELNTTFEILEDTENFNLQMDVTQKTRNTPRVMRRNMRNYRQNQDSMIFEISNVAADETIENIPVLKEISATNKTILSSFENLKPDDIFGSLNDISVTSYKDSPSAKSLRLMTPSKMSSTFITEMKAEKCLMNSPSKKASFVNNRSTPEIFPFPEIVQDYVGSVVPNVKSKDNRSSMNDSARKKLITPSKMSSTFITEMKAEKCLVSSLSEKAASVNNQSTSEIFRTKVNEISKKNPDTVTPFKSRLPQLKTIPSANKYTAIASPVANYINRGIRVQSASKNRHSHCINVGENKSQSETKMKTCKIPQYQTKLAIKKKLQLFEVTKHQ